VLLSRGHRPSRRAHGAAGIHRSIVRRAPIRVQQRRERIEVVILVRGQIVTRHGIDDLGDIVTIDVIAERSQRIEARQPVPVSWDVFNCQRLLGAQRAVSLQKRMNELALTDACIPVSEPPMDLSKMKRHHHPRYHLDPLPDAGAL